MNRTGNVVRMQLINRQTYIWVPLIVLAGAFILTLLIWALLPPEAEKYSGGAQAPYWYFGVVGVQALTLTFPFSQAMSVTRREYFFGTTLTAALTAAMLSTIYLVGGLIERATGGWGMNGYFFSLDWIWDAGPAVSWLFYFALAMLFFLVGFGAATVYKRFGNLWLTVLLVGTGLLLVGLLWLVIRFDGWNAIGAWIAAQGTLGIALWILAVAAAIGALSFVPLRKATP
ncbi:hypothetical protein [Microbacterium sp. TNHR37B]|uniref:hypothetical protein n=1 Tax=Microbacterium sp. TNHR37B TaxID=1775956 RepID=UPI0007B28396|nr:hypothetical protein [Microbacterium sp. TNHR37B]KZE89659.1 hypothetical protein AVP41_02457 [Microbacterium sp. TNHR37B]